MTKRPDRPIVAKAKLAGVVMAASIAAAPAYAGFPTIDAGANAKLLTTLQTARAQFTELVQMKTLAEEQLSAFGEFGVLGDLFSGEAFSSIGSKSEFYANMQNFAFDPCAINLCQTGDNPIGTTDIEEAKEWAATNFYSSKILSAEQQRDLDEVRRRAVLYAAMNGMALANVVHNDLVGAGEEADALEQIVESSQNLRGDIRANSAIALASLKIEVQQLAMLAAMLNVEATGAMAQTSIYHEEGGTEFPDAFIDSDYSPNDITHRTKVTVPEKGQ